MLALKLQHLAMHKSKGINSSAEKVWMYTLRHKSVSKRRVIKNCWNFHELNMKPWFYHKFNNGCVMKPAASKMFPVWSQCHLNNVKSAERGQCCTWFKVLLHLDRSKTKTITVNDYDWVFPRRSALKFFRDPGRVIILHTNPTHQPVTLLVAKRFTPNFVRLQW